MSIFDLARQTLDMVHVQRDPGRTDEEHNEEAIGQAQPGFRALAQALVARDAASMTEGLVVAKNILAQGEWVLSRNLGKTRDIEMDAKKAMVAAIKDASADETQLNVAFDVLSDRVRYDPRKTANIHLFHALFSMSDQMHALRYHKESLPDENRAKLAEAANNIAGAFKNRTPERFHEGMEVVRDMMEREEAYIENPLIKGVARGLIAQALSAQPGCPATADEVNRGIGYDAAPAAARPRMR